MPRIYTCGRPGKRTEFTYEGNSNDGVILKFPSGNITISSKLFKTAIDEFRGTSLRGGFSMTNPTPGGFGEWVQNKSRILEKISLTPRHASFIAAILRNDGYLEIAYDGSAVILKFKT